VDPAGPAEAHEESHRAAQRKEADVAVERDVAVVVSIEAEEQQADLHEEQQRGDDTDAVEDLQGQDLAGEILRGLVEDPGIHGVR
jgi:hypothetical protein